MHSSPPRNSKIRKDWDPKRKHLYTSTRLLSNSSSNRKNPFSHDLIAKLKKSHAPEWKTSAVTFKIVETLCTTTACLVWKFYKSIDNKKCISGHQGSKILKRNRAACMYGSFRIRYSWRTSETNTAGLEPLFITTKKQWGTDVRTHQTHRSYPPKCDHIAFSQADLEQNFLLGQKVWKFALKPKACAFEQLADSICGDRTRQKMLQSRFLCNINPSMSGKPCGFSAGDNAFFALHTETSKQDGIVSITFVRTRMFLKSLHCGSNARNSVWSIVSSPAIWAAGTEAVEVKSSRCTKNGFNTEWVCIWKVQPECILGIGQRSWLLLTVEAAHRSYVKRQQKLTCLRAVYAFWAFVPVAGNLSSTCRWGANVRPHHNVIEV